MASDQSTQTWGVTVYRNGEQVVTIESGSLAGREITPEDEDAIRCAAESLLAFIGEPVAPCISARRALDVFMGRVTDNGQ